MVDRDDDLRIGIKTSAITLGRADVAVVMCCYGAAIAVWALALVGRIPVVVILLTAAAAAAQAAWHYTLIRDRSRDGCFKAFRLNHWVGFTLFAGTVAGYVLHS
jgi:4-hydroxybenzoate polyprenyltransferase